MSMIPRSFFDIRNHPSNHLCPFDCVNIEDHFRRMDNYMSEMRNRMLSSFPKWMNFEHDLDFYDFDFKKMHNKLMESEAFPHISDDGKNVSLKVKFPDHVDPNKIK